MKQSISIIYTGLATGLISGIIMSLLITVPFITGDEIFEFISDGGSLLPIVIYYVVIGMIIGCIVAIIMKKLSISKTDKNS